jgi:galactokinase
MTVVAHAPGRVVLIGDHTDHAGGVSLTMAIDLGTTVTGRRGGDRYRLTSDQLDGEADWPTDPLGNPPVAGPPWASFVGGVAAELHRIEIERRGPAPLVPPPAGFTGRISSTVPVGAGLSSSAALELSLALAFGFEGTSRELALLGQRAEHRAVGVPCGLLDQLTSACGVEGHALLLDLADDAPEDTVVTPVPIPEGVDVVVVHSGEERALAGSAYAERRSQCRQAAALVGPLPRASAAAVAGLTDPVLRRRARHVLSECGRVRDAAGALRSGDVAAVGRLMLKSHASLRDDFEVSTPALDQTVSWLMTVPGMLGARLTGAGFGGCVVALCEHGALPDPAEVTGRGWRVRPSAGASARRAGGA